MGKKRGTAHEMHIYGDGMAQIATKNHKLTRDYLAKAASKQLMSKMNTSGKVSNDGYRIEAHY